MNCYNCKTELIWGADHDIATTYDEHDGEHLIETNLSCPKCNAFVVVWWGEKEQENDTRRV